MDQRLLAVLIAAIALLMHGCTRPANLPVGNIAEASQPGGEQVPNWRR